MAADAPKPPPRRARFQVHHSTAIVLMFTTGGLIWSNTRAYIIYQHHSHLVNQVITGHGFPFDAYDYSQTLSRSLDGRSFEENFNDTDYWMGSLNLAIAILILFSVWYACEWLIRRRELKKGP